MLSIVATESDRNGAEGFVSANPEAPEKNRKLLIDIRELAELTGLSIGGLYHMISQKRIPVVRLSRRCVRFRLEDITRWLEEKVVPPSADSIPLTHSRNSKASKTSR
jgi:excisionase family DNA binding protein